MCGTNYEALRRTSGLFDYRFYPIDEPRVFQIIGIMFSVLTIISAIVNVLAGVSTTGQTRQKIYAHRKSQINGRHYSNCLLVTTYLVTFAWSLLFVAFAAPVTLWVMLHTVCREETEYWRGISADKDETESTYTFNLTHYGLYRRPLDTSVYSETANSPSAVTQLCQEFLVACSTVSPTRLPVDKIDASTGINSENVNTSAAFRAEFDLCTYSSITLLIMNYQR
ncbi:unnamed protein product [Dicrocoelium dendriticum]|nr:unnamed protein product [Dicrocoelium dendriticum]